MRELMKLQFVFEDFDSSDWVDSKFIEAFSIGGLTRKIQTSSINSICEQVLAEHIEMELYEGADEYAGNIGILYDRSLFKRLGLKHDLSALRLAYDDGTQEDVFVPWDNEGHPVNSWQSVSSVLRNGIKVLKLEVRAKEDEQMLPAFESTDGKACALAGLGH